MSERCEELAGRLDALQAEMLTKTDIPEIASAAAEKVEALYAARIGRGAVKAIGWWLTAIGLGLTGWLAAHGYINPNRG